MSFCLDEGNVDTEYYLTWLRAVLDMIMLLLIMVGNSFIIFAVLTYWRIQGMPCGSKTSTYLVLNLSSADVLVGAFSVFYFIPRYLCKFERQLEDHMIPCLLRFSLIIFAHMASGFTLVAIAVDKYVAVIHAVRYNQLLNKRRSLIMVSITWILALLGSSLLLIWNNWKEGEICTESRIVPVSLNIMIGPLCQSLIIGVGTYVHWRIHTITLQIYEQTFKRPVSHVFNTRAAMLLLLIIICYTTFWAPFMVTFILKSVGFNIPEIVLEVSSSFININYLINPFIYACKNKPVKKAIRCVFQSWRQGHTTGLPELNRQVPFQTKT